MSMLKNAADSIQIGMEDFHDDDEKRIISSIRNLYAGMLLLFKYKLQLMSPEGSDEVLLKSRVKPSVDEKGHVFWIGSGNKTVELNEIISRLKSLNIVNVEWKKLENLQSIRNDIEHYYSKEPIGKIKEAVSDSLHLIIQFCEPYLNKKPADILGNECWDLLLNITEIYDAELKRCQEILNRIDWKFEEVKEAIEYLECPNCKSHLLSIENETVDNEYLDFHCESCQATKSYSEVIGPSLSKAFEANNYMTYRDSGEFYSSNCPECGYDTFLINKSACVSCFYELQYRSCKICGERLSIDEQINDGICGYCQYRLDKLMDE